MLFKAGQVTLFTHLQTEFSHLCLAAVVFRKLFSKLEKAS